MTEPKDDLRVDLSRLLDPDDAARLTGVIFDFVMAQPVRRFVTPEQVLEHIEQACHPDHVRRVVSAHVAAAWPRERTRAESRTDRLASYLTPTAHELVERLASAPVRLEPSFYEGLVKQEAVRHLVSVMVEETLKRFVQMLKPAAANGPLGKGLFARLGAQMETQLSRAAGSFVATSLDFLLGRLAGVLASEDTGKQLGRLRAEGVNLALELTTAELWKAADGVDIDRVLEEIPGLVSHNLARPKVRDAILQEAEAALELEGQRRLDELLAPEALAHWRAQCVSVGGALLAELAASDDFRGWLSQR